MSKQVDVSKFVNEHVPNNLQSKFRKHMVKWDESLRGLPISYWPTYDEDLLFAMFKTAEKE